MADVVFVILAKKNRFSEEGFSLVSPRCKDLIEKMLTYDPTKRITVTEALNHPFIHQTGTFTRLRTKSDVTVMDKLKDFKGISKLKKAALNMLVKTLDQEDLAHLEEEFHKLDKDRTGFINKAELEHVI